MDRQEVFQLMHAITRGLGARYGASMDQTAIDLGLQPAQVFTVILPAFLFGPDPISIARLRRKNPYNAPAYYEKPLSFAHADGFLEEVPEGGYVMTAKGWKAFERVLAAADREMERVVLLPAEAMQELLLLLAKLVQASILAAEPPGKWCILHSRRLDRGQEKHFTIRLDQYLSDLFAYRDDAHLASWASLAVDGHAWDLLTHVWLDHASSEIGLLELVKRRGWTEAQTHLALEDLEQKGWLSSGDAISITTEGRGIRDRAEDLTNQLFFTAWDVLTDPEYKRICDLLSQVQICLSEESITVK